MFETYPLLQVVPLGGGVVEHLVLQGQHHLPQEVVAAEHVGVPDGQPERAAGQRTEGLCEAEALFKHRLQRVLSHLGLALAALGLVRQQVHLESIHTSIYITTANNTCVTNTKGGL